MSVNRSLTKKHTKLTPEFRQWEKDSGLKTKEKGAIEKIMNLFHAINGKKEKRV